MTTLAIATLAASDANAEIAWQNNLRAAHAQAQSEGKLLLLHFYSDNCTWCERLEQGSFQAPQVGQAIAENFVAVKIHANTSPKLAAMFKVNKFPTDVIVTTEGKTLSHTVSPQHPDRYVTMLTSTLPALADATAAASIAAVTPPAVPSEPVTLQTPALQTPALQTPAESQSAPDYAAAPATPVEPSAAPELTLPSLKPEGSLSGGASAQLAGNRNDSPSFEMPAEITPPALPDSISASVTDVVATPTIEAPAATASPVITPPEVESVEPSAPVASIQAPATSAPIDQPELAMQGFCAVTVITEDKWVEGKPEYGVIHLGKLYLFTSEEHMSKFLADPVPYTPVLNEIDVVRFFEERTIVPGKREWGLKDPIYNRMFFFADEEAMNHFYNEYERYTDAAIEVMDRAVKDANPGT